MLRVMNWIFVSKLPLTSIAAQRIQRDSGYDPDLHSFMDWDVTFDGMHYRTTWNCHAYRVLQ